MGIGTSKTDYYGLLSDLHEFLDKYVDVDDGPADEMGPSVRPNQALELQMRVTDAMHELDEF